MTVWTAQTLTPEEAAIEPFAFDDEDRLELDGGAVVTLGTRLDGTPAVMIQCPGLALFAIADPHICEFQGALGVSDD